MNQPLGSPVAKTCSGEERECGRKQRETRWERANDFAVCLDLNRLRDADAGCGKDLGTLRVTHVWMCVVRPSVEAAPLGGPDAREIEIEADGELVGALPAQFSVLPAALSLFA